MSTAIQNHITQYCVIARDEMLIEEKCVTQSKSFNATLAECKEELARFFEQERKTCIPVTVQVNGEDQQVFLRTVDKTTYKAVNEDAFKKVIEVKPSEEELMDVYQQMDDPSAGLIDVYATWIFNQLYEHNTLRKKVFEISDRKERAKKGSKKNPPETTESKLPNEVIQLAETWANTQYNIKRLRKFKKDSLTKFNQEKRTVEPAIETFLASRPKDKQEQKISMVMHGENKPFYLKRVVETKKPVLTLTKTKPLIIQTVQRVLTRETPKLIQSPFRAADVSVLFQDDLLLSLLFAEFRTQVESFKQSNVKTSTRVELREKNEDGRGKKRKTMEDDVGEDGEEENEEEYNE